MSFRKISTSNLASTTTVFDDPIIVINNKGTIDNQDVGILAKTTANAYTGLFRDGTTKDYYLVEQYIQDISNNDLIPGQATLSDLHLAHLTASGITMSGSIIPDTDIAYDLGSPTKQWRDVYVGPGSLYVNGQKVLEDNSGTITVSADPDQSLTIKTSGTGVLTLQSATTINVASTLQLATGVTITSADGGAVKLGDKLDANNNQIINVGTPTLAMHAANKNYVDALFNTLVNGAPGVLDTLNELANAIGDDPNFITTINTSLAAKADTTYVDQQIAGITVTTDLASLTDVTLTTPTNGQVLVYDNVNGIWVNSDAPQGFDGQYSSLTGTPTIPADVSDLTDTTGLLTHFDGDYNSLTNKPTLFSGSYTDLTNKPTLFDGAYSSLTGAPVLATVATSGSYTDLANKPTIPTVPTVISAFTNDAGYLTSETSHADVVVDGDFISEGLMKRGATAGTYSVVTDNSANWNTAFGWGDHSVAGYLTSYTETDPVFSAHVASGITSSNITQWNQAYLWGNHATQGYLKTYTDTNNYLSGLSFNATNGVLTATRTGLADLTVDLDGRYLTSETPDVITTLSHNPTTKVLTYTNESGTVTNIDLTNYLDDTNLARITSGTMDGNGIATFTRDDATTFTVDMSILLDDTNLPRITSASWNTTDGVLTLTRNDATTVTADLDGRYAYSSHSHSYLPLSGGSLTGALDFNSISGRAITITADAALDAADASIYLGNAPSSYGYDIKYEGTGSGNLNAFVITSTNLGTPKELLRSNQDGIVNLPQLGATVAGNAIWHAGNDGAGSGLDADTLDGLHASSFLQSYTETDTLASVTSRGAITGTNVTLSGAGNIFNGHHYFTAYDANGNHYPHYSSGSNNVGATVQIRVQQPSSSTYDILRVQGGNNDILWRNNKIWNAGNDGAGSGLDADLLDGVQATSFLRSDAADTWTGKLTYAGSNEGLQVAGIRGNPIGPQTGEFIHLYRRVNIGYPSGWGGQDAPDYGLSTHGGAQFNVGNVAGAPFTFSGNTVWHAGNDGAGSGLDADTLDGQHASAFATSSHVHTTIHQDTDPASTTYRLLLGNGTDAQGAVYNFSDLYWNDTTSTIVGANINGTATYATTAGSANNIDGIGFRNGNSTNGTAPNNVSENGVGYTIDSASLSPLYGHSDGALYSQAYNTTWVHQIYGDYRSGRIATRGKNSGTWQAWNEIAVQPKISSTAPTSPQEGDFWWDDTEGVLNIYYSGAWVEASPAAASVATGSGSGLDADLVDGLQASQFLRSDTWADQQGGVNITKNIGTAITWTNGSAQLSLENTDAGWVGINFHRAGYTSNNIYHNGGNFVMDDDLSVTGNITASGDVTAYSDRRFKHNIETIDNALDKVNALRGTSYVHNNKDSIGVIAQEIEEVIPEVVHTDDEGMKSVAYGNLAGLFIEAIKEMDAKYSAKIADLEAQIEEMKRNG